MAIFTNFATLSYGNNTITSNVVTGEIQEALSINKTSLLSNYVPGDTVTYVVNLINDGTFGFGTLTLTDNLGAYNSGLNIVYPLTYVAGSLRYFVNGEVQTTPTVSATAPLTITGINLAGTTVGTLVYQAVVNEFASPETDGTITNTVTLTGTGVSNPVTAEETIAALIGPRLAITKTLSPEVVSENGQITYTFTIENFGNTEATSALGVVLTDNFDPILDIVSVTFNGTSWLAPDNYTYTVTDGAFRTNDGEITVPAATYTQNPDGSYNVTPGISTLVVVGNII